VLVTNKMIQNDRARTSGMIKECAFLSGVASTPFPRNGTNTTQTALYYVHYDYGRL